MKSAIFIWHVGQHVDLNTTRVLTTTTTTLPSTRLSVLASVDWGLLVFTNLTNSLGELIWKEAHSRATEKCLSLITNQFPYVHFLVDIHTGLSSDQAHHCENYAWHEKRLRNKCWSCQSNCRVARYYLSYNCDNLWTQIIVINGFWCGITSRKLLTRKTGFNWCSSCLCPFVRTVGVILQTSVRAHECFCVYVWVAPFKVDSHSPTSNVRITSCVGRHHENTMKSHLTPTIKFGQRNH